MSGRPSHTPSGNAIQCVCVASVLAPFLPFCSMLQGAFVSFVLGILISTVVIVLEIEVVRRRAKKITETRLNTPSDSEHHEEPPIQLIEADDKIEILEVRIMEHKQEVVNDDGGGHTNSAVAEVDVDVKENDPENAD